MRSMVLTGIRQMEMREVPDPKISNETDVLIKMSTMGVCGSDVHYFVSGKIGNQVVQYPFPVGHEGSGVVEGIGKGVKNVKVGDRVAIEPAMSCWQCDQCKIGRHHTCRKLRFLGCPRQADGCLSEYIVMPESSCFKIKDSMTMDQAALSEPLAIGVYAVRQSILMKGAKIAILGAGPIGRCVMLPARTEGAEKIYVTDKIDRRLEEAARYGADWIGNPDKEDVVGRILEQEPRGLDVVFECCGQQEALDQSISMLKPGGKLMVIGIPAVNRISFSIDDIRHKETLIVNVRRQCDCVQPCLDMIDSKRIDVNPLVTHHFRFDDTKEAFDLVAGYKEGVVKAMIQF